MSAQAAPPSPSPAPPLVGRERELGALRDALTAALAGRGSLVLIGGEAGIGKTALAEELCSEAAGRGALVLVGRCYDLSETPPYGPWAEAFARTPGGDGLPASPGFGGAATSQAALFGQVRGYLATRAVRRPLVLLLDDLHWSDAASLDLLRVAARDLAGLPLLVVGTYRPDELAEQHPLARLLPALVREAEPLRLTVPPLEEEAVRQLVRAGYALAMPEEARLIAYLQAQAAGNPLYLGELLRTLEEARLLRPDAGGRWALADLTNLRVPPLLRQVIAERLGRLGTEANRWLAVAAVIGQEVPLGLWAAVGAVPEEELLILVERASAARVLEATPDGLHAQFHHPLIRQALYEGLSPPRRRAVHQHVGDLLAASPHPDPDAVADHFQRAGDPRAVEWLVRAGLRARRAAALLTAAERFVAAAALLEGDREPDCARAWLLYYGGRLLHRADPPRTLRLLSMAEQLAAGDRVLAAYIRFTRGQAHCLSGAMRLGLEEMRQGVAQMADTLPTEYRLRFDDKVAQETIEALFLGREPAVPPLPVQPATTTTPPPLHRANLVNWLGFTGHFREALTLGEAFIAALTASLGEVPPGNLGAAHLGLGQAYAVLGRPAEARREYALAIAGQYASRDTYMVDFTLWIELLLVVLPYQADLPAERARLTREADLAWKQALGTITAVKHPSLTDLPLALSEGRWRDAHRLGQEGLAASISGHLQGVGVMLGILARQKGERDVAWARVRELHPAGPDGEPGDSHFIHAIQAQALAVDLALDTGDLPAAGCWIEAHARWLAWSGAVLWRADHQRLRARYAWVAGDLAAARVHAETALALATEPRQPLALLAAHRLLGELDTAGGDHAAASAHLGAALTLADACAAPYERALTLLAIAELHRAAGRGTEAQDALAEARAICDRLGAAPALARADLLAAKLALVRTPAGYPDGLTEREVAVLRLVAAGRSNREIAAILSVSERTVERHLENTYRKVGARNRADATAYAIRHNLT